MNAVLEQRTPEWFQARIGRITGSRIGAVLGHSPWQTRKQLLNEMVQEAIGERIKRDSPAMRWGREHEQDALDDFRVRHMAFDDLTLGGWHELGAYLGYSPDALAADLLVEVKAPYSQRLPPVPPPHYVDQVQLGMAVCDVPRAALHIWTPADSYTFWINREPEWWAQAEPVIAEFMADFRKAVLSPDQYGIGERDDYEWRETAGRYRDALAALKAAEKRVADIKGELETLSGDSPAAGGGVKLEWLERQGNVAWSRLAKDLHISEEQQNVYRGQSTRYARVTVVAGDE